MATTMSAEIPLILFAKAPIAGKVKTRLTSHCSDQQAADIAERLMQASIQRACEVWPGKVFLSVWLDHDHPFFIEMQRQYQIDILHQCDGDLGEKMRDALETLGYPAAVMGCDAPHISRESLQRAFRELAEGRSVIGPALDGGYYLLGLGERADALFRNKPWGQDKVLAQTIASSNKLELELHHLSVLNDVDEWPDLLDVLEELPTLETYLEDQGLI